MDCRNRANIIVLPQHMQRLGVAVSPCPGLFDQYVMEVDRQAAEDRAYLNTATIQGVINRGQTQERPLMAEL